jgi:hypothetical protein
MRTGVRPFGQPNGGLSDIQGRLVTTVAYDTGLPQAKVDQPGLVPVAWWDSLT